VERGFESAKDRYVPITQEDLDNLPVKTVRSVEISDFVKLEEVDPIYFDKAYYLAPSENGAKAFALLRQALEQTGRAAVAKVAIRDKESLCLVRPYQGMLTMETMFYANEVRSADELATTESSASKVSPRELQMAVSLTVALVLDAITTRFARFARLMIFLPYAIPAVIGALMWGFLYSPTFGPLQQLFGLFGAFLDSKFGTAPLFLIVFGLFGVLAACVTAFYEYRGRMERHDEGKPWARRTR